MTDTTNALRALVDALRERHYGRMPKEVQVAYDNARAILATAQPEERACCRVSRENYGEPCHMQPEAKPTSPTDKE